MVEPAPAGRRRELTVRAVLVAAVVAALMGAAEPAIVLRVGYGPNVSVVSAFLGFIAVSIIGLATGKRGTRFENDLVQTAGTAAGSGVGFMAVVLAAIDMLSVKWAGFAELLARGFGALPRSALVALVLAVGIGVALTLLESSARFGRFVPSPTAIGLGMLIPGFAVVPMVVGGVVQAVWRRLSPRTEEIYGVPLASGFITGEALVLLVLAVVSQLAPHLLGGGG